MAATMPAVDLTENRTPQLFVAFIIVYVLCAISVVLRFASRKVSGNFLGWDDWFTVLAFIFGTIIFGLMISWLNVGIGKHVQVVVTKDGMTGIQTMLRGIFVASYFYTLNIACAKFAILAFYWRIFGMSNIKPWIHLLTGITILWVMAIFITSSVSCIPAEKFWNPTLEGNCIDIRQFYMGKTIPNMLTDYALLALPLPYIFGLKIDMMQKVLIAGTFIIGGGTCIISTIRLWYIDRLDLTDLTWGLTDFMLWTGIECWCIIMCASVPSLRPIIMWACGKPINRASSTQQRRMGPSVSWSGSLFKGWSKKTSSSGSSGFDTLKGPKSSTESYTHLRDTQP